MLYCKLQEDLWFVSIPQLHYLGHQEAYPKQNFNCGSLLCTLRKGKYCMCKQVYHHDLEFNLACSSEVGHNPDIPRQGTCIVCNQYFSSGIEYNRNPDSVLNLFIVRSLSRRLISGGYYTQSYTVHQNPVKFVLVHVLQSLVSIHSVNLRYLPKICLTTP